MELLWDLGGGQGLAGGHLPPGFPGQSGDSPGGRGDSHRAGQPRVHRAPRSGRQFKTGIAYFLIFPFNIFNCGGNGRKRSHEKGGAPVLRAPRAPNPETNRNQMHVLLPWVLAVASSCTNCPGAACATRPTPSGHCSLQPGGGHAGGEGTPGAMTHCGFSAPERM